MFQFTGWRFETDKGTQLRIIDQGCAPLSAHAPEEDAEPDPGFPLGQAA